MFLKNNATPEDYVTKSKQNLTVQVKFATHHNPLFF